MSDQEREYSELLIKGDCLHNYGNGLITTTNGDNVPLYLSCRSVLSMPNEREEIEKGLVDLVRQDFSEDIIVAGLATAGISWAHAIASNIKSPLLYIRDKKKEYGLGGQVEGSLNNLSTNEVIIVDDVVYSGESVLKAIELLKYYNLEVVGVVCIARLGERTEQLLNQMNIKLISLTGYETLLEKAFDNEIINETEKQMMRRLYRSR